MSDRDLWIELANKSGYSRDFVKSSIYFMLYKNRITDSNLWQNFLSLIHEEPGFVMSLEVKELF